MEKYSHHLFLQAGSERLNVSFANGADKERAKETQSINKSLSALGDVIAALGEKRRARRAVINTSPTEIPRSVYFVIFD